MAGEAGRPAVVEANFAHPPGRNGYLLFGLFDQRDNPLVPPAGRMADVVRGRIGPWLQPWSLGGGRDGWSGKSISPSYQVQLYVESEYPLTRAEQEQALGFFRHVCPIIRRLGPGAERGGS
jgi:hypothetical protein